MRPGNNAESRHGVMGRGSGSGISQKSKRRGKESWTKVDAPDELNLFGMEVASGRMGNRWQPSSKIKFTNGDGSVIYERHNALNPRDAVSPCHMFLVIQEVS